MKMREVSFYKQILLMIIENRELLNTSQYVFIETLGKCNNFPKQCEFFKFSEKDFFFSILLTDEPMIHRIKVAKLVLQIDWSRVVH